MSRALVEAKTRGNLHGSFPDTTAVVTLAVPPADVLRRDGANGGDVEQTAPTTLVNLDTVLHSFDFALVGADVPGGSINLNPIMNLGTALTPGASLAADAVGLANPLRALVGDQAVAVSMLQAVTTDAPTFVSSFEDLFAPLENLAVVTEIPQSQLALLNNATPFVLDGPGSDFSTREVLMEGATTFRIGSLIVNQDTVTHSMTVTLVDSVNGDRVLGLIDVPAGGMFHIEQALPATLNLKEGQSLQVETATATTTTDPYVWAFYNDRV